MGPLARPWPGCASVSDRRQRRLRRTLWAWKASVTEHVAERKPALLPLLAGAPVSAVLALECRRVFYRDCHALEDLL
jgi:hypothetical protein